jgi:hypothetical protein
MNVKRYAYKAMLRMVTDRSRLLLRVGAFCCIGTLFSCTKADIMYIRETGGVVLIYPQYSGYTLPDVDYYFYNTDGESEYLHYPSTDDLGNFEGRLPVGTYRVIATNRFESASGFGKTVAFTGWESYDAFIVKATPDAPGSRGLLSRAGYNMLSQPDSVYSIVISEAFMVMENDTIRRTPPPTLLTKVLNLEFSLEGELEHEVDSVYGVLPGIYPGVQLSTGYGIDLDLSRSWSVAVNFGTDPEEGKRKAKILLFGVYFAEDYINILELTLLMKDGTLVSVVLGEEENMAVILSQALALTTGGGGVIPLVIRKTPVGGIVAEIGEWIEEEEPITKDIE